VRQRLAQPGRAGKRTQNDPKPRRGATASLRFHFPISNFCLLVSLRVPQHVTQEVV